MEKKALWGVIIAVLIITGLFVFLGQDKLDLPTPIEIGNSEPKKICSGESPIVKTATHQEYGKYLTDANCRTLYVYKHDTARVSECNDECAEVWIPMLYDSTDLQKLTDNLSKNINIITRKDGSLQYAFVDKALYYYVEDKKPGDVAGYNFEKGLWNIKQIE